MALTKEKLITHLQTQLEIGRQESRQLIERLFTVRQKRARQGRNPQTQEGLILAARKGVVFKSSGVLRRRINESFELPD